MADLQGIIQEMANAIPGFVACDVVGMDGMSVGGVSEQGFDGAAASAYFTNVMNETKKALDAIGVGGDSLEDLLFTTDKVYIFQRMINSSFYLGMAAQIQTGNLGMARILMKKACKALAEVLPSE